MSATAASATVVLDRRFNGPPGSANGGYACGTIAAHVDAPAAEVTLRLPVPLQVPLAVEPQDAGHAVLRHGAGVIAEARPVDVVDVAPPARPTVEQARAASAGFVGHRPGRHPLRTCFVCGVAGRADGLDLQPGPLEDHPHVRATAWVPRPDLPNDDGALAPALTWAALDCPSYPGFAGGDAPAPLSLLGRMAARIERPPQVGEELAVVGWDLARNGRKQVSASAVVDADGRVVARALALWIALRDGVLPAAAR